MERVSSGTILLAFIAILCGLLGVYSLRQVLRAKEYVPPAPPVLSVVPMAGRELTPGHKVTLGDVAIVRMTREQMKDRGVARSFMADPKQIIGRTLRESVERGKTFDTENFYPDGVGPGIAESLGPGQRAVTISIFGEEALIGFAGAGQNVDVLFKVGRLSEFDNSHQSWRSRNGGSSYFANRNRGSSHRQDMDSRAITLIQGVKVLALANNAVRTRDQKPVDKDEPIAVTLAVSPAQAEVLRLVEGNGEISLALRHPDDKTTFETIDSRTLQDVLGIRDVGPREMEVYRGKRVERLWFDEAGKLSTRYESNADIDSSVGASSQSQYDAVIGNRRDLEPAPVTSR